MTFYSLTVFCHYFYYSVNRIIIATKFAVGESLSDEMDEIGVKVKIIESGAVFRYFGRRSINAQHDEKLSFLKIMSSADMVSEVNFEAATDDKNKLRYTVKEVN